MDTMIEIETKDIPINNPYQFTNISKALFD